MKRKASLIGLKERKDEAADEEATKPRSSSAGIIAAGDFSDTASPRSERDHAQRPTDAAEENQAEQPSQERPFPLSAGSRDTKAGDQHADPPNSVTGEVDAQGESEGFQEQLPKPGPSGEPRASSGPDFVTKPDKLGTLTWRSAHLPEDSEEKPNATNTSALMSPVCRTPTSCRVAREQTWASPASRD